MIGLAAELVLAVLWARVLATCVLGAWACRARAHPVAGGAGGSAARVSVVVPAFDEEQAIAATLHSLLAQVPLPLEILVVDDGSSDATAAAAGRCLAGTGRGRVIRLPANIGKAGALQAGLAAARGDHVLTLDADTRLAPGALAAGLDTLQRRRADAVAFALAVEPTACTLARLQQLEYATSLDFERAAQDAVHAIAVLPGAACLFRREVLQRHPFSARTRTEDADLTLTLARHGARIVQARDALAWTLAPLSWAGLVRQRTRWITGHVQCCALHAVPARPATWRFGLLVLPNFVLSTFMAPAGLAALLALWVHGGGGLLPFDAWGATVVSTVLAYTQRATAWLAARRPRGPRLRHFLLEPAFSSVLATVCLAQAARGLLRSRTPPRAGGQSAHRGKSWT